MRAVGDGSRFGARVSYVDQERPGGIAQAVGLAKDAMAGSPFVTFLGDNFLTHGIVSHVQAFEASRADAGILLKHVDDPREFGVAQFENERLVRVIEKPADPPSDLAVIGIYFFTPKVFDAIAAIKPSARGELEITDTIQWLLDSGANLRADIIDGGWIDTGKHDDLLDANRLILETLSNDHCRRHRRRETRNSTAMSSCRQAARSSTASSTGRRSSASARASSTRTSARSRRSAPTVTSSRARSRRAWSWSRPSSSSSATASTRA